MVRYRGAIRSVVNIKYDVVPGGDQLRRVQRPVIRGDISGQITILRTAAWGGAFRENGGRIVIRAAAVPQAAPHKGGPFLRHRRPLVVPRQIGPYSQSVFHVGLM